MTAPVMAGVKARMPRASHGESEPNMSNIDLASVSAIEKETPNMTERSILLEIEGMTCGHCAQTITRHLRGDDGVKDVRIDWESGLAEVTFDPGTTNEDKILSNRAFQQHYKVRLTSPRGCC